LDPQAARDLFAYFYAARFFDKPADAGRGKHVFADRGCRRCHGLTDYLTTSAKPVSQWKALDRPFDLAREMWNHQLYITPGPGKWPKLSTQDLLDIQVYLRNLPLHPSAETLFTVRGPTDGAAVFESRGCAACHSPAWELMQQLRGQSLTAIAAEMWNHAPRIANAGAKRTEFTPSEMQALLSYLWVQQFFQDAGKPEAGRHLFASKHCASCHHDASTGAPEIEGKFFTSADMVAALWRHGPQMLDRMQSKKIPWPRFDGSQMSDLIAYLNKPR